MRIALAFLIASACFGAAPVVTNITFDGIGDSSFRVMADYDAPFITVRVYAAVAPAACTTGQLFIQTAGGGSYFKYGFPASISGLLPSTLYNVCPEASLDEISWSAAVSAQVTTTAQNSTPVLPTNTTPTWPTPSGSVLPVTACVDLQSTLLAARRGDTVRMAHGLSCTGNYYLPADQDAITFTSADVRTSDSRITVPMVNPFTEDMEVRIGTFEGDCLPGNRISVSVCRASHGWMRGAIYYVHLVDATHVQLMDAVNGNPVVPGWVQPTAVDTTGDTITLPTGVFAPDGLFSALENGGFSNSIQANLEVQFHSTGTLPAPLVVDTTYYLAGCTSKARPNNSPCVTQILSTSGGSVVNLTTAGTGTLTIVERGTTASTFYLSPAPSSNGQYITWTTDGTLPPVNTRITPGDAGQMADIKQNVIVGAADWSIVAFPLAHNWRIRGLKQTTGTSTQYLTTLNPGTYSRLFHTQIDTENVFMDQCYIHGQGYPQRMGADSQQPITWQGRNVGFINCYMDGLDYWRGFATGFAPSVISTTVARLATGSSVSGPSIYGTVSTSAVTNITITAGSGITGNGKVFINMSGTMQVILPNSISGVSCTNTGISCAITNAATPTFPVDGNGLRASCPLATLTYTAGNLTAVTDEVAAGQCEVAGIAEGTNMWDAGGGPGPYLFNNNYISGAGLMLHFDDSGGPLLIRTGFVVTRNFWDTLDKYVTGQSGSDTLFYRNRQPLEWKGGQQIDANGNIFRGNYSDGSATSSLTVTPRAGGVVTDITLRNIWFKQTGSGMNLCAPVVGNDAPVSKPCQRQFYDNILMETNGFTKHVTLPRLQNGAGWVFDQSYANEDPVVNRITYWKPLGNNPRFLQWVYLPIGKFEIKNSVIARSGGGDTSGAGLLFANENITGCVSSCAGLDSIALLNAATQTRTFSGNAIVPSWSDTYTSSPPPVTSVSLATVCTELGGVLSGTNCPGGAQSLFFGAATVAQRWADLKYVDPDNGDFHLDPTSPLIGAGVAGANIGVDFDELLNANGVVRSVVITPSTSSALMCFIAPDAKDVYLGVSTDAGATWTYPTTVTGTAGARCGTVTGLLGATAYLGRVLGYYDQTAALGFSGGMLTTQSFTTALGAASFRGAARVGVR